MMRKLVLEFVIVWIAFFGIQAIVKHYRGGQLITYMVSEKGTKYKITENYTKRKKNNRNAYYFDIKANDEHFIFQTYESFGHQQNLIQAIHEYRDDQVQCILPVLKENKVVTDMICKEQEDQIYYREIHGKYEKLDEYVSNLKLLQEAYRTFLKKENTVKVGTSKIYTQALPDDKAIAVSDYRGITMINADGKKEAQDVFKGDVYDQKIKALIGKYYLIADYEQPFEIDRFYLVDLAKNKKEVIESKYMISKDSYVQGIVENSVYLYDRSNQKQYEINVVDKTVYEVGNVNLKIQYYDGAKWSQKEMYDIATTDIYFETYPVVTEKNSNYDKVIRVGGTVTGYYYYFQSVGDAYKVYRAPVQNSEIKTYVFTTTSLSQIYYAGDDVYFMNHNDVQKFCEISGIQTVLTNSEFEFNPTILYGIYEQ